MKSRRRRNPMRFISKVFLRSPRRQRPYWSLSSLAVLLLSPVLLRASDPPDMEKIIGPEGCGECHQEEFKVWTNSAHQTGFKKMHRLPEAKSIAKKLGLKRIKSSQSCISCHYTPEVHKGKIRARQGVSCESCHGEGKDWLDIHQDFGGSSTQESETSEHRSERLQKSHDSGMRSPSSLYDLASSCYPCHSIANEELVDQGGHPPGVGFELLSWSQGGMLHNFKKSGERLENRPATRTRKRTLFILGKLLDLEHDLRAIARATQDGESFQARKKHLSETCSLLESLNTALGSDSILEPTLALTRPIINEEIRPGQMEKLKKLADKISSLARDFVQSRPKNSLEKIDSFLPPSSSYKGQPIAPKAR